MQMLCPEGKEVMLLKFSQRDRLMKSLYYSLNVGMRINTCYTSSTQVECLWTLPLFYFLFFHVIKIQPGTVYDMFGSCAYYSCDLFVFINHLIFCIYT